MQPISQMPCHPSGRKGWLAPFRKSASHLFVKGARHFCGIVPATYHEFMTRTADVIIVGGGIIGCSIARELARRGARVRLFEARTVGGGATHASAGVLAPYIEGHDDTPLLDLGVRSLAMYDDFIAGAVQESGIDVEFRRCGTLEVAVDEASAETLRQRARHRPNVGRWLDAASAREAEPGLAESAPGGLLVASHGYVAAGALTEALAWAAMRHGAEIEADHRVTEIRNMVGSAAVITEDGIEWSSGDVVVCAGSWTSTLQTGVGSSSRSVRPIRGQLLRLAWQSAALSTVVWGPNCYAVPWRDGTVLIGATVEDVGFDERTTAAGVRDLLDAACELLPAAWRATFVEARAGLRPATDDGLPIIGRAVDDSHVVYATGHYRNGVLLAPLTARLVADLLLDDITDPALATLRP
jgi:glycine oxidase